MQDNHGNNKTSNQKRNTPFFFEIDRFIPRLLRNWLIYLCSIILAVFTAIYVNNWYLDRIYLAESTFHVGSNSNSNSSFGSNSINFIWGGASNKIDVLTKVLESRTHSYDVAKASEAYIRYLEEGTVKKSSSHRDLSPFIVKLDTAHNQVLGVELQILESDKDSFEIKALTPLKSNQLYNYHSDSILNKNVNFKLPKKAKFNDWITTDYARFKIIRGSKDFSVGDVYSFKLINLDEATNIVKSGISVSPLAKGSSVIKISKTASTQQEAIDIVNSSLKLLRDKELEEKNLIATNTLHYIEEQMGLGEVKVDSAYEEYQELQKDEKIYDFGSEKGDILGNVLSLEKQKVAYQERISALNSVSNNVSEAGTRGMMALQIAGLDEPNFTGELSNLRQLEERKKEMLILYQPSTREVEELYNKIEESKSRFQSAIDFRHRKYDLELFS